jgi:hypothetical protein
MTHRPVWRCACSCIWTLGGSTSRLEFDSPRSARMCDGSLHDSLTTHGASGANDPCGEGCISKGRIIVQRGSLMERESNKRPNLPPLFPQKSNKRHWTCSEDLGRTMDVCEVSLRDKGLWNCGGNNELVTSPGLLAPMDPRVRICSLNTQVLC